MTTALADGLYHWSAAQAAGSVLPCNSENDLSNVPLESIRDRGSCLEAANALFAHTATVGVFDVTFDSGGASCSGCWSFVDAGVTTVRFCDYNGAVEFDGTDDPNLLVPQQSLCVSSAWCMRGAAGR